MASDRECDVANALTLLAESNLSSIHSSSDLRKMVEDYFCAPSDAELESDSDSDSNCSDEERTTDLEIADDLESENEEVSVDKVTVVLKEVSSSYVSEDAATETDTVRNFRCSCQLNDGGPCFSRYQPEDLLSRRMQMQELTTGNY